MENKTVTLIRKQATPFTVTYPSQLPDGRVNATFSWLGTKGKTVSKKPVPVEVFRWLNDQTTTIKDGHLILEEIIETEDPELNEIKGKYSLSIKELENGDIQVSFKNKGE
jgi:hypothetical protein